MNCARTIIRAIVPKISPEVHEQRGEARMRRQELLESETAPRYRMSLDEAVLHRICHFPLANDRSIGDPAVMAEQADKLLKLASEGKVTLQVVPFSAGPTPSLTSVARCSSSAKGRSHR